MVFLNPAILFGLLASSIPVLIHLLNLRKLKKVEFSTLSFLKELQKTKIRRIKLKQWILLILRVLIILFLVLSFARPALETVSFGVASTAKTTAVIVIDNSFSMSAVDENGSLLNQAKATSKKLLNEFKDGDEVALIISSSPDESVVNTSNLQAVSESISGVELSNISRDLSDAVQLAYGILSNSQNFNKEIYLFSDFQQSRSFDSENITAAGNDENIKLYFMPLGGKDFTNLAVTSFETENQIFELNKDVSFKADVTNYSGSALNNNVLSLFINGKRSAQSSFDIEPGQTVRVGFQTTISEPGLLNVFAELEEDDITYDNRRYLDIYVPEKIKTLLLTDKLSDVLFVETALAGGGDGQFEITKNVTSRINSYNLIDYDAVILIGSGYSGNVQKIEQYLTSGGAIIIMPGSDGTGFENLCAALRLPRPEALVANNDENSYSTVENVDYEHPLFANLFENGKMKFDSPEIYKYMKILNRGNGRTIMSQIDGSLFLGEYNSGEGKIMMFTAAPVLSWSNFPIKGLFAPLINKSVFYLVSANKSSKGYIAGDELVVEAGKAADPQIRITRPDNSEEFVQPDLKGFNSTFKYSKSDETGTYEFYSGNTLFDYIPVNFNIRESELVVLSPGDVSDKLSAFLPEADIIELDRNSDLSEEISQARFGTELWKPFLIIALLLALLEMWIAKSTRKDLAEL